MGHDKPDVRHTAGLRNIQSTGRDAHNGDFVLEKTIFNNVFEKDIRKVYIYKKAERLAKALHLIAPAFTSSPSLRNRSDALAIGLIDAALEPSGTARAALSRELLALSSVLSIARTSGLLSAMNAELISKEAHSLLQEVAGYEEPRLFLEDVPSLADIAKSIRLPVPLPVAPRIRATPHESKGQIKDIHTPIKDRRDGILSVIHSKKSASIKDISVLIRGVSEKTIQRELSSLISEGIVKKQGERRWSTYSMAS